MFLRFSRTRRLCERYYTHKHKRDENHSATEIVRLVEWADLDAFQHVNNKVYFAWQEAARIQYLKALGLDNLENSDYKGVILAETSCQYLRPVLFPDCVKIRTKTVHLGNTSWTLECEIRSEQQNNSVVALGTARLVFYDYRTNTKIPCPDSTRKQIQEIERLE
eukprot:TRINITY_DN2272_c0_g1_i6.p1 TRINITY_DN2272_c0_g1~~TRINITY_DN2272_c0_g1_i6.p1  ORF type:complete len:164 (+),score=17.01 TRINITY_DN2272_c0_g1_i6:118-609(+)